MLVPTGARVGGLARMTGNHTPTHLRMERTSDGVVVLTLDNRDQRNVMSAEMTASWVAAVEELDRGPAGRDRGAREKRAVEVHRSVNLDRRGPPLVGAPFAFPLRTPYRVRREPHLRPNPRAAPGRGSTPNYPPLWITLWTNCGRAAWRCGPGPRYRAQGCGGHARDPRAVAADQQEWGRGGVDERKFES